LAQRLASLERLRLAGFCAAPAVAGNLGLGGRVGALSTALSADSLSSARCASCSTESIFCSASDTLRELPLHG